MMNLILSERELLVVLRRQKRLKQSDIAKAIGVTQGAISHHEIGLVSFSRENYEKYKEYIVSYVPKIKVSQGQNKGVI